MDDYSRFINAWKLTTTMAADDVKQTLDLVLERTGVDRVHVRHRPRLLSDSGPCYVSRELGDYLAAREIGHTRGKPYHTMTQGKIERYHRTMKNVVKLQNYYLPWELERQIERLVDQYNHRRVHEPLDNLTPADVYQGRAREILTARNVVKPQTLRQKRRHNLGLPPLKSETIKPAMLRQSVS